ncbi:MAG: hypothetical protein U0166_01755 [Acidobacteriota bacterium]
MEQHFTMMCAHGADDGSGLFPALGVLFLAWVFGASLGGGPERVERDYSHLVAGLRPPFVLGPLTEPETKPGLTFGRVIAGIGLLAGACFAYSAGQAFLGTHWCPAPPEAYAAAGLLALVPIVAIAMLALWLPLTGSVDRAAEPADLDDLVIRLTPRRYLLGIAKPAPATPDRWAWIQAPYAVLATIALLFVMLSRS